MEFTFASHSDYWVALLPEAILVLAAVAVLMGEAFGAADRDGPGWAAAAAALGLVAAGGVNAWLWGSTGPVDALVAVDAVRGIANFIVLGGGLLVVASARDYLARERLAPGPFHALLLMAAAGMMLLASARDLILLFVSLELMSIAVYVLTGFARRDPRSSEAGMKYFIVGAFASAFLLYGIALLFGVTGTTRLATAAGVIASGAAAGDPILIAGLGLLLIGFAFKVAAVPFHMWTPDAYEGAPIPVTAFMATGVKTAAFVALFRVLTQDLGGAAGLWHDAIWWLALLTMMVPNLIALAQDSVKRMLAYSSVGHAGYLLVGVVAATELGRAAGLFYLAAYTVMTVGAFAVVSHVAGRGERRILIEDYRGLGWRRPWLAGALVVFLLSLAGFPPTAGFIGKLYLLQAAVEAGEIGLAVVLVLTSLVAYYYYLRVVWKMYFDRAPEDIELPGRPRASFGVATAVCAILLLLAGVLPGRVVARVRAAVASADATLGIGVGDPGVARPAEGASPGSGDPAVARTPAGR